MYKKIFSLIVLMAALAPLSLLADKTLQVRIVAFRTPIRQAAALEAPVIIIADKGQVFDVIEKADKWYLIQLPSGGVGYLHKSVVEEVAEAVAPSVPPPAQVPVLAEQATTQAPIIARQLATKGDSFSMFLGRFGYFLASDSAFKDIYGNGTVFGGELRLGGKRIVGWLEGSYRERVGKFSFTGEKTKVKVTGIEVGALYRIIPGNISPYAGAGVGYYMFNENNDPIGTAKQSKIGFCGAAGVSMFIGRSFVLDVRAKFSTCAMKPADFNINVGGITLGLGAGFRF
jgi:opacity protein-like surface antigen